MKPLGPQNCPQWFRPESVLAPSAVPRRRHQDLVGLVLLPCMVGPSPPTLLTVHEGERLHEASRGQSLNLHPGTTWGEQIKAQGGTGQGKAGGVATPASDAPCQPMDPGHPVIKPGAKNRNQHKRSNKPQGTGWGGGAGGAVFGFCAWPLPVLHPYLCSCESPPPPH